MYFTLFTLFVGLAAFIQSSTAIATISTVGNKFFTSDGNQFFLKGVAYQMTNNDPLVNTAQCQRDAALMAQLGANSIRVYHVDPQGDHNGCMNAFAEKGIYLWVDLDTFSTYIRFQGEPPNYNQTKSEMYRAVVDNFQQYDNTAGYFVGNEVLNVVTDAAAAPYLIAAAVDIRAYGKAKGYRDVPIGYSATDTTVLRPMLQDYLVCRPNATERLDFYAINSYEWCGASSYQISGYDVLQQMLEGWPVPIFFSEDGCNTQTTNGRSFDDQQAIFTPPMSNLWSGAIIYEWQQEINNYGLISYGPPNPTAADVGTSLVAGYTRMGTPSPVQPDFSNLQAQWATLSPSGATLSAYKATVHTTAPPCPSSTGGGWTVDPSAPIPTVGQIAVTSGMPTGIPKGSINPLTPATSRSHVSTVPAESSPSSPPSASRSHASSVSTGSSPSFVQFSQTSTGSNQETHTGSVSGSAASSTGTGSASGSASASAASASATTGGAGKGTVNPLSPFGEISFVGCLVALFTVGAGAVFLL